MFHQLCKSANLRIFVRKCAKIRHEDLCLSKDTRNLLNYFECFRQGAVDLWEILKPVLSKFYGDAEKLCCSVFEFMQDYVLPKKNVRAITFTNIF